MNTFQIPWDEWFLGVSSGNYQGDYPYNPVIFISDIYIYEIKNMHPLKNVKISEAAFIFYI